MESKHSSSRKKYSCEAKNTSFKSNKSSGSYSDHEAHKLLKTPKLKVKGNPYQKTADLFHEVKKPYSPLKKHLTSSPTGVETAPGAEYLLLANSLHQEESLMSLDMSFQSQEEDSKADIHELSDVQPSDSVAQPSVLRVSDSSSVGEFDKIFSGGNSAFSAHVAKHSSPAAECDVTSDCPDAATLSASAAWDFDEASYTSVTFGADMKSMPSCSSSKDSGSNYISACAASLMSRSPISLGEIPVPPSPQRHVHIQCFSNTTENSALSFNGNMASTFLLSSSPNELASTTQEKRRSLRRMNVGKRERILKPAPGKALSSMVTQLSRYSAGLPDFRSCPKKRLSLSSSLVSRNSCPAEQPLEQRASNLTGTFKFVQSQKLKTRPGLVQVSGISHAKNFSKGENSAAQPCQTAFDFSENLPSNMMMCEAKSSNEFMHSEMDTHSVHLQAGPSSTFNTSYSAHLDANGNSAVPFNVRRFLQERKSYGMKLDSSASELDCSSDRPFDYSGETRRHSHNGPLYDHASLPNEIYSVGFIDTHCHLDFLFNRTNHSGTLSEYIEKMASKNNDLLKFPASYEGCVAVFCQPDTFHKTTWYEQLLSEKGVWATFGCHPHFSASFGAMELYHLKKALEHPKVVALGEIGLDYSHKNSVDASIQQVALKTQLAVAVEKKLPLVIHSREAHQDTLQIIKQHVPANMPMHRHCFTETWKEAVEWLETFPNCFIGFTNLVSQRCSRGKRLAEVVRKIPLNRLLLETDAPYFAPECVRAEGVYNAHPGYALHVAAEVARVKGLSVEEVLVATRRNTTAVYGI